MSRFKNDFILPSQKKITLIFGRKYGINTKYCQKYFTKFENNLISE